MQETILRSVYCLFISFVLFFDEYCKLVFNEDTESANWNYDQYFLDRVNDEIESCTNPLGMDMFDDID